MTNRVFSVFLFLFAFLSCASGSRANASHDGKITLDQFHNVFFGQFASNTFSLQLLQARDKFDYKTLVVGGQIEADAQHWQGNNILTTTSQIYNIGDGVYLTSATIDFMAKITPWGTGFISPSITQIGQGGTSGNYYYLPNAFFIVGNLDKFPLYLTVGITTLPFGIFTGSGTWDEPLTSAYFNPQQAPQLAIAYYKNHLNLNAALYQDEINYEYHHVFSLLYNNSSRDFQYGAGAGYLTNLKSNTTGNVNTARTQKNNATAMNIGDVVDVNATAGYKLISLSGEFIRGSNIISGTSGKPRAYSLTLSYTPTILDKITTFGINHSVSLQLNNISTSLPGQDYIILAAAGLKNMWAMSVSQPFFNDAMTVGLDAVKATTYDHLNTYAYTLDLIIYI